MGKAPPLSLLRETDFVHQGGVTRIGVQRIEQGIDTELAKGAVVFPLGSSSNALRNSASAPEKSQL